MFCRVRADDFVADAASFDPSPMLAVRGLAELGGQLDKFVSAFCFLEVVLLFSFAINLCDFCGHVFRYLCSPYPPISAGVEANSARVYLEEASNPEELPAFVFEALPHFFKLRGSELVSWIFRIEHELSEVMRCRA